MSWSTMGRLLFSPLACSRPPRTTCLATSPDPFDIHKKLQALRSDNVVRVDAS